MRVVVTGGCGFAGRHLCDGYADRGDEVLALDMAGEAWRDDVEVRHGDLRDPGAVEAALHGAELVVHNASLVHTANNRVEDVWAVNLGGTENVMAACRRHGVGRLVYMSSASVVYEGRDIRNGNEGMPYASTSQAPYADSKIAAEKLVLAAHDGSMATCAIRPHVIFGPHDRRLLPAILARARAGKMTREVGDRSHLSDFTYIDNLVDAVLAAGDKVGDDAVGGQAYFVTNGEPMPFFTFVDEVLKRIGQPPIRGRVPFWIAYSAASVAEAWDTMKGGTLNNEDGFTRFAMRYLCTHHYFDISKARRDLGYEPRVSILEGLDRTLEAEA